MKIRLLSRMEKPMVIAATTDNNVIEIIDLKKYFALHGGLFAGKSRYVRAIDGLSINIGRAEIVGLVGESGSGKTTLARVILNLIKPTNGRVIINGVDMARATKSEMSQIREKVSVVFQDPASNLNPRQTLESSIIRPMVIHGKPKAAAREKARETMNMVKMDEQYLRNYPHQLSGGQLQRIAIARALALEPQVMILDEPTSALDISVQAQVLNLLLDLQEGMGLTYLIITHDLNVIRYFSDRVAVMYLGKIVEYGSTAEVTNRPKHPYTQGLMAASPVLDPGLRDQRKILMSGEPGSILDLPPGCRFSPRCGQALECCKKADPPETEVAPNHVVSCFLYEKQL